MLEEGEIKVVPLITEAEDKMGIITRIEEEVVEDKQNKAGCYRRQQVD